MHFRRISTVFLRYFYVFTKLDYLCDLFYWPALDIVIWGMTSRWIQNQELGEASHIALGILTALVLWQMVWRGNFEITSNLLEEFWNRNLVNLFSTPLRLGEWMIAVMGIGTLKGIISLCFGAVLVYLLYALNVFSIGWVFLPFCFSLILSGWWIGFLSAGCILYFGKRAQMLAWITAYLFSPFSAVFYPISALPNWAQPISYCLPMSYIFEGMRKALYEGVFSLEFLVKSLFLNALFLSIAIFFFKWTFEKSREKGFARLE